MQLIIIGFCLFFIVLTTELKSQVREGNKAIHQLKVDSAKWTSLQSTTLDLAKSDPIEFDILSSYYSQDGNNSAVTGGIGTEKLTDFSNRFILSAPVSQRLTMNFDAGIDYYSSASTDNIDHIISSDSSRDIRVYGNISPSIELEGSQTLALHLGVSQEYDYQSLNGGISYNKVMNRQNTSLDFSGRYFKDKLTLYYPIELRGQGRLVETDQRNTLIFKGGLSQVLGKRILIGVNGEWVHMKGLLSTPFHRVYFAGQEDPKVERLPSKRTKNAWSAQVNYFISDQIISRMYYRYYWDDWNIQGHTIQLELPVKLKQFLSIIPFYRYHNQDQATYFDEYKSHTTSDSYYTSDYDLSDLSSHSYGISLLYSPLEGLSRLKLPFISDKNLRFHSIALKFSKYDRSNDLHAFLVSIGMKFKIE